MDSSPAATSPANSPTLSVLATQAGLVMGTAACTPPRGQGPGDRSPQRRVLVWRRALRAPHRAPTLSRRDRRRDHGVGDPARGGSHGVAGGLNPRIAELIQRCLEKNPKKRWQAMGDLRLELEALIASPHHSATPTATPALAIKPPMWKRAIPIVAAVIVTAMGRRWRRAGSRRLRRARCSGLRCWRRTSARRSRAWRGHPTARGWSTSPRRVRRGSRQLMLRTMGDLEARPVAGAEGRSEARCFLPTDSSSPMRPLRTRR